MKNYELGLAQLAGFEKVKVVLAGFSARRVWVSNTLAIIEKV